MLNLTNIYFRVLIGNPANHQMPVLLEHKLGIANSRFGGLSPSRQVKIDIGESHPDTAHLSINRTKRSLTVDLRYAFSDGSAYQSLLTSRLVPGHNYCAIETLILDNQPQKLNSREEIESVLRAFGAQIRSVSHGEMPEIQITRSEFTSWGRFKTRMEPYFAKSQPTVA